MHVVEPRHRLSLCVSKEGDARFMGQLDFGRVVDRSLRRSGLPVQYTRGFNPRIKLSFADALPLGIASEGEWVSLELNEDLSPETVRATLAPALPESVRLVDVRRGPAPAPAATTSYRLDVREGLGSVADALIALLDKDEYVVQDPRRKRPVDARALLVAGETGPDHLQVDLVVKEGRPGRPGPVMEALTRLAEEGGHAPPAFGTATKQLARERRQGEDDAWHDAAATRTRAAASS